MTKCFSFAFGMFKLSIMDKHFLRTSRESTIFYLKIYLLSFRGGPSVDPSGILPRNPSADPSAESFRGSFRGILPQSPNTIEEILPRSPSADPSAESFRGSFRKILPRRPSVQKIDLSLKKNFVLPRILPQSPSAESFRGTSIPLRKSFRGILPRSIP